MPSFPRLIYNNKFDLPSLPPPDTFKDQTILITGATGGLGLATAVHFVNLGASTVIITGRTSSKCEAAKTEIESQTGTQGKDMVKIMELDMSTFAGVKVFADQVKKEVKSIDYVLLNAGMMSTSFRLGKEGFEESIEINTLSTALLALLLLPWMKEVGKGKAHLGVVTSGLHRGELDITPPNFPQTNILTHYNTPQNYPKGTSGIYPINKLLTQYCIREISKLALGPDGTPQVIVNPMCPGMVKSDLGREYKTNILTSFLVDSFMTLVSKTTEGGARTLVLAALTTKEENGMHYTNYMGREEYEKIVQKNVLGPEGQKMQAEVWKEVIAVLGERVPEVKGIVGGA
ncbi:NAD(P)-binding protein [Mollisia scopiformis]|uniref:NAD(P)-binding protein n=1 Tax=Mollisia scopiformis TaxID=149040 RepID=A0A194XD94_MOLSC|nr:NAD(P)-binding protein [Mollisia scopiformis]KUJ18121.1 NAD(P)-binding protein [Mollisia scopiformis]